MTTSISLNCSFNSFSVFAIWPGYHCKVPIERWKWTLANFTTHMMPSSYVDIIDSTNAHIYLYWAQGSGPVAQISIQGFPVSLFFKLIVCILWET
jgi:hypothetical protein